MTPEFNQMKNYDIKRHKLSNVNYQLLHKNYTNPTADNNSLATIPDINININIEIEGDISTTESGISTTDGGVSTTVKSTNLIAQENQYKENIKPDNYQKVN